MYSELGEDISLQTTATEGEVEEEVQNNRSEGRELFDLNSLPPGYRFNPTDAETIVYYLRKKVDHQPLPPNKIIEVNLYAYDPEELAARYEPCGNDEWFYFTPRDRKYPNGQRPNRSITNGHWKATGADKEIKFEDRKVGYRKSLVFYRGSPRDGVKTNWMMHEFRVAEPPKPPRRSGVNDMRLDDCVLCKIYRKEERISKRSRHESGLDEPGSSSSKIPRLELNPNEANDHPTVGGGMDSGEDRINHQYNYNSSQTPLQTQQPQPTTEIFQTPQGHDQFSLQSNPFQGVGYTQFPVRDPRVMMPWPTSQQSIHCVGNECGGQGLDNFNIMNGAFVNNSFDARNINFGNNGFTGFTDLGNHAGLASIHYGNPGIYYGNNDAQRYSSNTNGNYGSRLLPRGNNHNGQQL
ncbi:NAC domain-containing protein 18-like [Vitis riparia]|uniref:NAC domain-containing protein 18-like n=1 Tax=Vitis riparia TaxID=96939 RepID=UPI00155AB744|nr:NAC domain-containing protein 18-like [Vitis riparia]